MPKGEKLLRFLVCPMQRDIYGTVTIRFESGKVTHVEMRNRRTWEYKALPVSARPEVPELTG
jgi:argininosuccinate synthase